jgi:plasmid stability protein
MISLPAELHYKLRAAAAKRQMSVAALVRDTLEQERRDGGRLGETRATYTAVEHRTREEADMKRIVITLPDDVHSRIKAMGSSQGVSMAAYIRSLLEARMQTERPKPRFGAFDSGFTDTARLAGEIRLEPRSWR